MTTNVHLMHVYKRPTNKNSADVISRRIICAFVLMVYFRVVWECAESRNQLESVRLLDMLQIF